MTVIAYVDLVVGAESAEAAPAVLADFLEGTRSFEGCDSLQVLVDAANGNRYRVVATWRDEASEQVYREWRRGPGRSEEFAALFAEPPVLSRFLPTSI